jgi:hypothetical protein
VRGGWWVVSGEWVGGEWVGGGGGWWWVVVYAPDTIFVYTCAFSSSPCLYLSIQVPLSPVLLLPRKEVA